MTNKAFLLGLDLKIDKTVQFLVVVLLLLKKLKGFNEKINQSCIYKWCDDDHDPGVRFELERKEGRVCCTVQFWW